MCNQNELKSLVSVINQKISETELILKKYEGRPDSDRAKKMSLDQYKKATNRLKLLNSGKMPVCNNTGRVIDQQTLKLNPLASVIFGTQQLFKQKKENMFYNHGEIYARNLKTKKIFLF